MCILLFYLNIHVIEKPKWLLSMINLQYWWLTTVSLGTDLLGDCFLAQANTCSQIINGRYTSTLITLGKPQTPQVYIHFILFLDLGLLWHTSLADTLFLSTSISRSCVVLTTIRCATRVGTRCMCLQEHCNKCISNIPSVKYT